MNKAFLAISEMSRIDELSNGNSFLHYRHPLFKLVIVISYIAVVMSIDSISKLVAMFLIPSFLYALADIPLSLCFHKLRAVLPFVIFVGVGNLFIDRQVVMVLFNIKITAGFISFLSLALKGILALLMSFVLVSTTSIEKICYGLSLLHLPSVIISSLLMTYRYVSLLLEEAGNMLVAYSLRAPGQKGIAYSSWGSFLGSLLLRTMDRAKEIAQSMELRGYDGNYSFARSRKADYIDYLFLLGLLFVIFAFGMINISQMIGKIFI